MAQLVEPNKIKHRFVVGIDFGHGETSASVSEIDWNATAGTTKNDNTDIIFDMNGHKVIVSAIASNPAGKYYKGEDVFMADAPSDLLFRISFKKAPVDIHGEDERLMIEYMKIIYGIIREKQPELEEGNHIVYIARPSGDAWKNDDVKKLYKEMALKAGIPLAGLTSESRAAIFYSVQKNYFAKKIDNGIMVFDLGSSTLDFTYYNAKKGEIIDGGDALGGAEVDEVIYDKFMEEPGISDFVQRHPDYKYRILFQARRIKEDIYSHPQYQIPHTLSLVSFMRRDWSDYAQFKNVSTTMCESAQELTDLLEMRIGYWNKMRTALLDFREEKIKEQPLNGVILVGGASAMNFIEPLIKETYELSDEEVKRDLEPSLTVSRGIALLGRADCMSIELQKMLERKVFPIDKSRIIVKYIGRAGSPTDFVDGSLPTRITDVIWSQVYAEMCAFKISERDMSLKELEQNLKHRIYEKMDAFKLVVSSALQEVLTNELEEIRGELNKIINIYAPDREIQRTAIQVDFNIEDRLNWSQIVDPVILKCMDLIQNKLANIVKRVLWGALRVFLWQFYLVGEIYLKLIKSESEKELEKQKLEEEMKSKPLNKSMREKAFMKVLEMQDKILNEMKFLICSQLISDSWLCTLVGERSETYLKEIVYKNIESVKIPIE